MKHHSQHTGGEKFERDNIALSARIGCCLGGGEEVRSAVTSSVEDDCLVRDADRRPLFLIDGKGLKKKKSNTVISRFEERVAEERLA